MKIEEAKKIVKKTANDWSNYYINQVNFEHEISNIMQFVVEFSKPDFDKPIPESTVKVYFNVIVLEDQ